MLEYVRACWGILGFVEVCWGMLGYVGYVGSMLEQQNGVIFGPKYSRESHNVSRAPFALSMLNFYNCAKCLGFEHIFCMFCVFFCFYCLFLHILAQFLYTFDVQIFQTQRWFSAMLLSFPISVIQSVVMTSYSRFGKVWSKDIWLCFQNLEILP